MIVSIIMIILAAIVKNSFDEKERFGSMVLFFGGLGILIGPLIQDLNI